MFALFPLAICAVCFPSALVGDVRIPPWLVLYVLATILAVAAGAVTLGGLVALAFLLGLAWEAHQASGPARLVLILLFAALAIALSIQAVPGVGKVTSPLSSLNVGKFSAGLLLFALLVPRASNAADVRRNWKPTLAIGAAGTVVTVSVAAGLGYLHLEPKLLPGTAVALVSNLLFTCIAEESFVRGLLQEEMHRAAERTQRRGLHATAVAVSAVVFGAAHAAGGLHLVLLATLGGITNALAYAKARKVEASVVTHFMLNAAHFLLFAHQAVAR
ncbi:type II CAAX prenyl endopeptidase Rce1 family protein [Scleromatobacter humisilvae]|uniref:CPBP family glutamic-type intramembrane protease n=1 Tax=Scleromatobacter humisilvae TaxID=2897159 RepID=A0A9X2C1V9_9BURK|nr:CPBP family glutamic-type intramembrane protease [Scleromatobacter humisilvae]MCK9689268.1 CPBP family glutamic-type intramembrane protease [Scleromatobacter humisilvae]